MTDKPGYLPTLDGWRAFAVLMVILCHDRLYGFGSVSDKWFQDHGGVGVDIFFGISGLLICSRLLEEEKSHGLISLRGFYTRRVLRILPAAYVYLLVIVLLRLFGLVPLISKEVLASAFFFRNYTRLSTVPGNISWYTGHFWSLAVEEHFYLLLPSLLVLTPKRWRIPTLCGLALLIWGWRLYRQQNRPWSFLFEHTDTRLDALLFPAIVAIFLEGSRARAFASKMARLWFIPVAIMIFIISVGNLERLAPIALALLMPLALAGTVLRPVGLFAKFLELAPLRFIGRISYSLYLWQELFFTGHTFPYLKPLGMLQSFPMRWVALFAVASASYFFLEKPCIRWGHRLAPPVAPGRPGE